MKTKAEIEKGLKEMETRKSSYSLDLFTYKEPNSVVYDTELIRKMEVTDATIHALRWVLHTTKKTKK